MKLAQTVIDTDHGSFIVSLHADDKGGRCVALALGDLQTQGLPIRLHSSCVFSEAFGACDCDCGAQLRTALAEVSRRGAGVVVYLYQEGRGAGLELKMNAMSRQRAMGINSYEAYADLGLPRDMRDYALAVTALSDLGVSREVQLMSNNPLKREAMERHGFRVVGHVALSYPAHKSAYDYLVMKQTVGRHAIDLAKIEFFG
jgi:GTP cyclohydrolase II